MGHVGLGSGCDPYYHAPRNPNDGYEHLAVWQTGICSVTNLLQARNDS